MYRRLEPDQIAATAAAFASRIDARFPGSGLSRVSSELVTTVDEAILTAESLARPPWLLRTGVGLGFLVIVLAVVGTLLGVRVRLAFTTFSEFVQGLQAVIQNLVFFGIAVVFLLSLERRRKRRLALSRLHSLRSLAHIIDMHQLTKDPDRAGTPVLGDEPGGPEPMKPAALFHYLDFCSDLLSLISKAAALYVQDFDDSPTLAAVNEIENLTAGLSRKIWQKIMILDRIAAE